MSEKIMRLFNPKTNKSYNVKKLRVVKHDILDKVGEPETRKCVEFIVIGNNHEWKDWLFYEDFESANMERIANKEYEV